MFKKALLNTKKSSAVKETSRTVKFKIKPGKAKQKLWSMCS